MEPIKLTINSYLQRISNILLIHGGFLTNPGLFTGEMGLVVFFSRYAHYTHNDLYADYSFDLTKKIQSIIHQKTPNNYMQGLTGIGAAIEYLVQYDFFEADTDDILEAFDKQIFAIENLNHLPVDELLGILYYAYWRIAGNSVRKNTIMKKVMPPVVGLLREKARQLKLTIPSLSFFRELIENKTIGTSQDVPVLPLSLQVNRDEYPYGLEANVYNRFIEQIPDEAFFKKNAFDLGLHKGLAGFGMALMTQLDGDDSWISLFPNDLIPKQNEPLPV